MKLIDTRRGLVYNIKCEIVIACTQKGRLNMDLHEDKYISIDEAADYLGIKPVTLRNWIKKKPDIPAHKVGKLWKFKRSELDEWVKSGGSALE